ncbi:MAG: hypothetical protein IJ806_00870 [Ruminococcus sp.]|nr:hypothetical protein [Ruminococcus sp.]
MNRKQKSLANDFQLKIYRAIAKSNESEAYTTYQFLDRINALTPDIAYMLYIAYGIEQYYKKYAIQSNEQQAYCDDNYVNTDRLYIGMTVKDYKELCSLVYEEPKTGKSKQLQIENWRRYFDFEKLTYSNQYIILDIYNDPKERNQYRSGKYLNEMKVLLLALIYSAKENPDRHYVNVTDTTITYCTTYRKLIDSINLVKPQLFDSFLLCSILDELVEMGYTKKLASCNYRFCQNELYTKIKQIIDDALKSLENNDMITVQKYNVIVTEEKGEVIHFRATDEQEGFITSANKIVANDMGYKNSNKAKYFERENFRKNLNDYYNKKYGWKYVYYEIKIIVNIDNFEKNISEYTALSIDEPILKLSNEDRQTLKQISKHNLGKYLESRISRQQIVDKVKYIEKFKKGNVKKCEGLSDDEIFEMYIKEIAQTSFIRPEIIELIEQAYLYNESE